MTHFRSHTPDIFLYTALPCEAKPLIRHFNLKKNNEIQLFEIYSNKTIYLTVTGVGKVAMATAIGYTQALLSTNSFPVLINIGIAGHQFHQLGSLFLIDQMVDADSGKRFYPPLTFSFPCPSSIIQTASRPISNYQDYLYDMEATAFYETATRFTHGELAQCLKVISDNEQSPAANIQPKCVEQLIAEQLPHISELIETLRVLASKLVYVRLDYFRQFTQNFRFTITEKHQLQNLLLRWSALNPGKPLIQPDHIQFHSGKEILLWLDQQLNETEFFL